MLFDPRGTKWVLYGTLLIWALAFFVIGFRTAHDKTATDLQHDKRDVEPNIDTEEGDDEEKDDEGDDDDGSADHGEHDDDEEDDKDLDEDEVEERNERRTTNERRKKSDTKNKKNKLAKSYASM
jgi:hypothetical protein